MADILYLVERLEQILAQGWRVPFTTNAVIDEDAFIDIVEQMHIAIPTEIRQAQQIVQQKERVLAQAREEAERIVEQARERAEQMVEQTDLVARANERSQYIIVEAQKEAEEVRFGADGYATDVLSRIRDELEAYLLQVDNGLERLRPAEPHPSTKVEFDEMDEEDDGLEMDEALGEPDFEEQG